MTIDRGQNLRALRLGQRLKRIREDANLTMRHVGEYIRRDVSTVSRIESGALPARVPEVLAYLDLCGVDDPRTREGLKLLSKSVFDKVWWDTNAATLGDELMDLIWVESLSDYIEVFDTNIPGLLQTPDYMEAVMQSGPGTPEEIREWVAVRSRRQEILTTETPTQYVAIIDESALRRVVGSVSTMKSQLEKLLQLGNRRNVSIQILELVAGAHIGMGGVFSLFKVGASTHDAAAMATQLGAVVVEGQTVEMLRKAYDGLKQVALNPNKSRSFITKVIKEL